MGLSDLEKQQADLAAVQLSDFRSANLFRWVTERIPNHHTVLDVGCGAGGLVAYLLESGLSANGIDISEATVKAARDFLESRGHSRDSIQIGHTEDLVAAGHYADTVVSMDCLEHVDDDQSLFDELVALTRPGGTLIITVPALMGLYGERDDRIGHYRRYEKADLEALIRGAPLVVHELRFWNFLGVAPTFLSQVLTGNNVDEGFRYGPASLRQRALRRALHTWFRRVENRISPPLGMSLLLHATRRV